MGKLAAPWIQTRISTIRPFALSGAKVPFDKETSQSHSVIPSLQRVPWPIGPAGTESTPPQAHLERIVRIPIVRFFVCPHCRIEISQKVCFHNPLCYVRCGSPHVFATSRTPLTRFRQRGRPSSLFYHKPWTAAVMDALPILNEVIVEAAMTRTTNLDLETLNCMPHSAARILITSRTGIIAIHYNPLSSSRLSGSRDDHTQEKRATFIHTARTVPCPVPSRPLHYHPLTPTSPL